MKIRPVAPEQRVKVAALLRQAFAGSRGEGELVERLHAQNKIVSEWACLHVNTVVAYIAFTRAYKGREVCGLHLGPLAVKPELQGQGVGSELLRFALRQTGIREQAIFVLGPPSFFQKFGFAPCVSPSSPFRAKKATFLALRHSGDEPFVVEYEPEFYPASAIA